jgi:5-methylcytosine-specific restriction endonuclease McrA
MVKQKIPSAVRNKVWNEYIGIDKSNDKCFCCNSEPITRANFECGHIISEYSGGEVNLKNLRPICSACNKSVGTKNMLDFMKQYHFDIRKDFYKNEINDNSNIFFDNKKGFCRRLLKLLDKRWANNYNDLINIC